MCSKKLLFNFPVFNIPLCLNFLNLILKILVFFVSILGNELAMLKATAKLIINNFLFWNSHFSGQGASLKSSLLTSHQNYGKYLQSRFLLLILRILTINHNCTLSSCCRKTCTQLLGSQQDELHSVPCFQSHPPSGSLPWLVLNSLTLRASYIATWVQQSIKTGCSVPLDS